MTTKTPSDNTEDSVTSPYSFEQLSHLYMDYLEERQEFVAKLDDTIGMTVIYKDTQSSQDNYIRPVVVIRNEESKIWYNKKADEFRETIHTLVKSDPYTYSPKSPRLKEPEYAKSTYHRIALHEQISISSRAETASDMVKRLRRNVKKAQQEFRITFSNDSKTAIKNAEDDLEIAMKLDGEEILRRRSPSSSDVSINQWISEGSKPERERVSFTGIAFYIPKDKDAVLINGEDSLYWPLNIEEPKKIPHHEAKKLADSSSFVAYAPRQSEKVGGKERCSPIRDAFDNGLIKPLPFKTLGISTVYLEKEIEAFRESVSKS